MTPVPSSHPVYAWCVFPGDHGMRHKNRGKTKPCVFEKLSVASSGKRYIRPMSSQLSTVDIPFSYS